MLRSTLCNCNDTYILFKRTRSLWQYYRYGPFKGDNSNIIDVSDDLDSASFKCRQKITGQTGNSGTKDDGYH